MISFLILLFLLSFFIFILSIGKVKKGHFYQDTFWLFFFGIYVWGDGLVLGPFWMISSIILFNTSVISAYRFLLIFFLVRSAGEVLYWLVHQASDRKYQPPLFRKITFLDDNQAAILYQLAHTSIIVILIYLLLISF